jgi:ATPase subunit of ABC transporter with duplicated ATPase domains
MPPKKGNKSVSSSTAAAAKAAAIQKDADPATGPRQTSEQLKFQIRSGPDAPKNKTHNLDIELNALTLFAGRLELLTDATLKLNYGQKYGLVGRNGVGKSTLLKNIVKREHVPLPEHVFVLHVEQEIEGDDTPVLRSVIQADSEREWLLKAEEYLLAIDPEEDADPRYFGVSLMEIYERLDELQSDDAETRAAMILTGLGFDYDMQCRPTKEFSGGWRMRIALAQALFMNPDLLLLDEPTNHLDVPSLVWLEEFLLAWERCVVIVSHDRGFLNRVTEQTIFMHRKNLLYYGGNYDTFVRVRAEHMANQQAVKAVQDRKCEHLKNYIAKYGQGYANLAAQAQSRMKMLKKLQDEAVTVDSDDPYLTFDFASQPPLPPPCISVIDTAFGYDTKKIMYQDLNFGVDCESRVAICGKNGVGKSTFLNLLSGDLVPTEGAVRRHAKLVIAKFSQHHIDNMELEEDSITHIRKIGGTDQITINQAYTFLGGFGLGGEIATNAVKLLSGGQKSRLAFAMMSFRKPHIMLLDEPTNHLDLETIEGLAMAINRFEGGVVLVSHDERLIKMVADELWIVMPGQTDPVTKKWTPGTISVFNGTFGQYKKMLKADFLKNKLLKEGKAPAPAAAPKVATKTK